MHARWERYLCWSERFLFFFYSDALSRRPAWTDRILHQVHPDAYENVKLSVTQSSYDSHPNYTQSDHKPVSADYCVKVPTFFYLVVAKNLQMQDIKY